MNDCRRLSGILVLLLLTSACDHHPPRVRIRRAGPKESVLIRTTTITGTIDRRHPQEKQVELYCPDGIPDLTTKVSAMRFKVVTDDFERDVPPVASIVSAQCDVRTNGHFLSGMSQIGIDPRHPESARQLAAEWRK